MQKTPTSEQIVLLTPIQLAEKHRWPIGGLRHLLFHREQNGLSIALRKVGSKLLINEQEFLRWVDNQKEVG
jgi:hypothetical protein